MNKYSQAVVRPSYDDEIDIREMFGVVWGGKWLVCGIMFAAAVVAVFIALSLPNVYRAEALLAPNDQDRAGGLSALASQYGGLASLAGINVGAGTADKADLALEILRSRKFISEFIVRHELLVPLMAVDGWNAETGELTIDADAFDVTSNRWVRRVSPPKKTVPSLLEAYESFKDVLTVNQNKKSGFVTVAISHYSPEYAKTWVDMLIQDLNSSILHQDVTEAEQAIEYLNEQISNTPVAELQNVFFNIIEEQTKTVMLASVSKEYMFITIDPAVVPERKAAPNRAMVVVIGIILGGIFGVLAAYARNSYTRKQ